MKILKPFLLASLLLCAFFAFGQNHNLNDKLPLDPKITTGKLPCGLTYFIQHNEKPENRAVFFLAVDAGAVLETDEEAGLAHFTEHLGFNGTKQFPGNSLVDELEKKGIYFGGDINAGTGYESTQYYVVLPTDDSALFDMGLKILDGWAFGMLMTSDEIDKERGVIIEEWRGYLGANERMDRKTMPIILKGSRYPHHDVIGTLENLQNFKYETVRGFYKKWYRPENMAIIVVGDVDVADMEKRIVDFFWMNDKPTTPFNRPIMDIPDNVEPLIAIATDPEATGTSLQLNYKHAPTSSQTYGDYRENLVRELYSQMLGARMDELAEKKDSPFDWGYSYFGSYWTESKSSFSHYYSIKDGKSLATLEQVLTELRRAQQHGFTETELARAKAALLTDYENQAKESGKTNSRWRCYSISNYFLKDGNSLTSDSLDLALAQEFLPEISLDEVNAISKEWIHDDNVTLAITMPETKGVKVPTEKQVLDLLNKCKKMNTTPYFDAVNEQPFLAKEPKAGKVVSKTHNDKYDCTELTLSNGVKVFLKTTDFQNDEIQMLVYGKGGTSLYPDNQALNASEAAGVIRDCGIGNYSPTDLAKFRNGKSFSVWPYINSLSEGISAWSTVRDVEYMLQYVYMVFETPRKDAEVFERKCTEWRDQAKLIPNSPDYQFIINFYNARYPNNKRNYVMLTEKMIGQLNLNEMFKIYKERFSNAADFTFVLVGNIDESTIIPLLEKYVGGLPATDKREDYIDRTAEFAKGKVENTFHMGLAEKAKVGIATRLPFEYSDRNEMAVEILSGIVDIKLTEVIREKLSGTYGTYFSLSATNFPQPFANMYIQMGCEPERVDELTNAIWAEIDKIIQNGPEQIDLDKVKEQMTRDYEVRMKNNSAWTSGIVSEIVWNEPFYSLEEYKQLVNSFTVADIQQIARYMNHDEFVRCVLMPGK